MFMSETAVATWMAFQIFSHPQKETLLGAHPQTNEQTKTKLKRFLRSLGKIMWDPCRHQSTATGINISGMHLK